MSFHATPRHFVLYYQSEAQLGAQLAALLQPLAADGLRWLYVTDAQGLLSVPALLRAAQISPDAGTVLAPGRSPTPEPVARIAHLAAAIEAAAGKQRALQGGLLTVLIDLGRALDPLTLTTHLREYEAAIDALSLRLHLSLICLYQEATMLDRQLLNGLYSHPAVCGHDGALRPNPHYVPLSIFARRDERAQFQHWLGQIGAQTPQHEIAGQLQPIYNFVRPQTAVAHSGQQGRWQIVTLGRLRVDRQGGEPVAWAVPGGATAKTRALFAYLLFCGEAGASIAELADLFWPDAATLSQSRNRLYHTVHCLRQALSPQSAAGRESPFLVLRDDRYCLLLPPDTWIDLPVFQEYCYRANQHAQNGEHAQAAQCYQAARQLYSGDLLADLPTKYIDHSENDWCWSRRYWFRSMYLKVLHELSAIYRQTANIPEALALCDEALRLEPCSDLIHQEKLRVLHAANRRDALHRQYRLYCKALERFGIGEPSEETAQLYRELSR